MQKSGKYIRYNFKFFFKMFIFKNNLREIVNNLREIVDTYAAFTFFSFFGKKMDSLWQISIITC